MKFLTRWLCLKEKEKRQKSMAAFTDRRGRKRRVGQKINVSGRMFGEKKMKCFAVLAFLGVFFRASIELVAPPYVDDGRR